jgi:hypothetical protein
MAGRDEIIPVEKKQLDILGKERTVMEDDYSMYEVDVHVTVHRRHMEG